MVEANVKIIEELKSFLKSVAEDEELRGLVTMSGKDFTRNRKLNMARLTGMIINLPKRSLAIEIQEFFETLEMGIEPATKGAFSLQRSKLRPVFFHAWNKWLISCFYEFYGSRVKRWKQFRLQAVDGSTAYLINTKEVVEQFGTQNNQHGSTAMARVMQIYDILNNLTVWGVIRPICESEKGIIARQVSHLYEDSLTLFDRGYPSFALMYLMLNQETPRHFIMRCKATFNSEVRQFVSSGKSSQIIELGATREAIAALHEYGYKITYQTKIKVRMVKVMLSNGEVEVLLTNLYDERLFPVSDLKYLYGLRWGIETAYGKQKNQMQMEQFSGHRTICIQQDYAAGLFVANLQSLIEKQCQSKVKQVNQRRQNKWQINRNISWASLKHNIIKLFLLDHPRKILRKLQKAFQRNLEPIRPGRQNPRTTKAKRLNGKYQTVTNYRRAI